MATVDSTPPLVEEAMKKAAVAWVGVGQSPACVVWGLWTDGAYHVVSGPGEQPAPGLADATSAVVTARGDHGGRVLTWPARVSRLTPGSPDWERIAPALAAKRLNAAGTAERTIARWAAECVVSRIVPDGAPTEAGETLPDGSGTAPPRPSPALRPARSPFRLHRVRRR